jgi:hypothetical protein
MSVTREQFFNDPGVIAVLDEYADAALNDFEALGTETALPDPVAFLKRRGINEIPEGPIEVHRTFGQPDQVMRPLCPDGSDGCVPKCRMVHGEWQCVWVCRCL